MTIHTKNVKKYNYSNLLHKDICNFYTLWRYNSNMCQQTRSKNVYAAKTSKNYLTHMNFIRL